jgi:hypothetical protein
MRAPHAALATLRGIFVRRRIPKARSCSSRCRLPALDATVFSHGSFGCEFSSGAARGLCAPGNSRMRSAPDDRPRWLPTPCALRLREPKPDVATSDTLCHTVGATGDLRISVRRRSSPFGETQLTHAARTPNDATRLEVTPAMNPGCLPSARCSTSRPSEALRVPCYVRAKVLAPVSPDPLMFSTSNRRTAEPRYSAPTWFASRLPSPLLRRCCLPTSATDPRHEHP